jgi:hypothetical protein
VILGVLFSPSVGGLAAEIQTAKVFSFKKRKNHGSLLFRVGTSIAIQYCSDSLISSAQ